MKNFYLHISSFPTSADNNTTLDITAKHQKLIPYGFTSDNHFLPQKNGKSVFLTFVLAMLICFGFEINNATAQLLRWNTFGNTGTETTEPSVFNDANISVSNLTMGSITGAANGDRYGGNGWFNTGNTVAGNTLAEAVAGGDYIQFAVTANAGFVITPTSFVFSWQSSGTGPKTVTLRSSADNFTTNIATTTVTTTITSYTQNITTLTNVGTTTFRLYGYGATATTGTGGFDVASNIVNVQLNGSSCQVPAITTQPTPTMQQVDQNAAAMPITVTATGSALTYQWYSNTNNNNTTGTLIPGATNSSYTPATDNIGTIYYYVVVTGTCGSISTNTAMVVVNEPLTAGTITGTSPLCTGSTTSYSSDGNTGGTWSSSNMAVATVNASTGVVTAIAAGNANIIYTVTRGASSASASKTLTVNERPTAVISGNTTKACSNTASNLSIQFTGVAPFVFSINNGSAITTSTNPETVIVMPDSTTTYKITSLADANCAAMAADIKDSAIITIKDSTAPVFSSCPPSINANINKPNCQALVSTINPNVSDNCSNNPITLTWVITGASTGSSAPTGINYVGMYTFNAGLSTVTYTAKDVSGNTSTCTYNVSVANQNIRSTMSGTAAVRQNAPTTANIVFSAFGGTAPYLFSYHVSEGSDTSAIQTVSSFNNPNNTATVPHPNNRLGQFIYTLLSVTDSSGCPGLLPADVRDTINVVEEATVTQGLPDFTSVISIDVLSLAPGASKDFVVNINEVANAASNGQLAFRIPKGGTTFPITFSTTSGMSDVNGGTANQNSDFTFTSPAGPFFLITLKPGRVINPFGSTTVGFRIRRAAGVGSNTSLNITSTISNGSGGDNRNNNNSANTIINAQ